MGCHAIDDSRQSSDSSAHGIRSLQFLDRHADGNKESDSPFRNDALLADPPDHPARCFAARVATHSSGIMN
jgi:hypothetical protein